MSKILGTFPIVSRPEASEDERGLITTKRRTLKTTPDLLAQNNQTDVLRRRSERNERGLIVEEAELLRVGADVLGRVTWSVETTEADRPLLEHPEVISLLADYGGYFESSELQFPEFLPAGKRRRVKSSRVAADSSISPLAGRKDYGDVGKTVRKEVVLAGKDAYAEDEVAGLIFKALPAGAPNVALPRGQVWRAFVSTRELARAEGPNDSIVEVTVEYRSGTYPEEIYFPWYG
jgi:hypothetical protein